MAQSSNYKQYGRTTRVLTEESGFAGGMLWTGNNIDETHLKAIVNCDYDDTTGYLKARDPFTCSDTFPDATKPIAVNMDGCSLLGTYSICAFDKDDTTLEAGQLYIFTNTRQQSFDTMKECVASSLTCIYYVHGEWYLCELDVNEDVTLLNTVPTNILLNYENQLFGLGRIEDNSGAWLNVYRVEQRVENETIIYTFKQQSHEDYVQPKIDSVNLMEACVTGFNAARGKATFEYGSVDAGKDAQPHILGVYFTEASDDDKDLGNIIVSPRVGQNVCIHVPIAHDKSVSGAEYYLALFQLKENGDSTTQQLDSAWKCVELGESTNGEFLFYFQFNNKKNTLGFTLYKTRPATEPEAYASDAVDYLLPYVVTTNDMNSNLKLKSYDLSSVSGSCVWKNRMCVWGVQHNNNTLLLSEVDNFYYYPVPNNVALFDTNVISCIPYKDTLLVFTANKIYRIAENNDGSFIQSVVQNDMPLTQSDAAYLTAIKNMVLFKSGNYFYMIVPKSQSLTDELSVAPIYKNIAGFLNTLDKSVLEVLQLLYPEYLFNECNTSAPTAAYSEQDTVHILYDVYTNVSVKDSSKAESRTFKLFLNYNTNLRAWTMYIEDTTTASLEIASLTSERIMSFVRVYSELGVYKFDIVTQSSDAGAFSKFRMMLDTGYRTLSTAMQKRFREIQLRIHNDKESITSFGTAFLVDGMWRRNYSKLQETVLENNMVGLMPVMDLNTFVTELSMPVQTDGQVKKDSGSDAIELNSWTLDFSHFKREAPTTVRIPVSGKGFSPRFILMAPDAIGLTINEINWVYRLMYGR